MLESLFRFFFEYRPVVFQQGEFRLSPGPGAYVALGLAGVAVVLAVLSYRRRPSSPLLLSIRIALIALLAFCLFRPVLIVKAAVAQQNFLAVLIDDSRSMQIDDSDEGQTRGEYARQQFGDRTAATLKRLSDKFVVRTFRFSSSAARLGSPAELTFGGVETKLGAALEGARQELAGLPLAGMVLVSDGADTTDAALTEAVLSLKAAALPVFTVGVGQDRLTRDIQVDRVSTPRQALKGTSLLIDAVVKQTGYAGETVTLDVEDAGRIVGTQQLKLPADGEPASVRVRVMAGDAGPRVLKFRISPQRDEVISQNNARESLVDVLDRPERILYFEGQPRFEMKFIRQAIKEDKNLQLVTLLRTAESKYLRLGVDDRGTSGRRLPQDARRTLCLSRPGARQRRGIGVHGRPAADDRGVRREARRRAARARRQRLVQRRGLCRHAGGRRPACRARSGRRAAAATGRRCRPRSPSVRHGPAKATP